MGRGIETACSRLGLLETSGNMAKPSVPCDTPSAESSWSRASVALWKVTSVLPSSRSVMIGLRDVSGAVVSGRWLMRWTSVRAYTLLL